MSDDDAERAANAEETLVPRESDPDVPSEFSPFDELADQFLNEPLTKVMADDGLPRLVAQDQNVDIPALSTRSLVCMGDFSKFVIRSKDGWRDVRAIFDPSEAQRAPDGRWRVPGEIAAARLQEKVTDGARIVGAPEWVEVEPIRPPCKHYVRQSSGFDYNPQHSRYSRLCSARRTTEGAFMTVADMKISACDMREPRDLETEKVLDDFDTMKIQQGSEREFHSIFENVGEKSPAAGIFEGKGS